MEIIEFLQYDSERRQKFFRNLIKFSAPGISVFFAQLALGAELKVAGLTALFVFWGLLADFFKKIGE